MSLSKNQKDENALTSTLFTRDEFITVTTHKGVTKFNTKYYTLVGTNIVTKDSHCRVVSSTI